MKVSNTGLGWELRPENDAEEKHIRWLIESLTRPTWAMTIVNEAPPDVIISSDQIARAVRDMSTAQKTAVLGSDFFFAKPAGDVAE